MPRKVEIGSVVGAVYLAPAEREEKLDIARRLGVVGELLVVVEAEILGIDAEILVILSAVLLEVFVKLGVSTLFAEGLELHLLKLNGAEGEVAGGYLVSEGLAYLADAERQLGSHRALHVEEVDIFALSVLGSEIDNALSVIGNAPVGLEHQVEFPDRGEVMLAAVGARN